MQNAGIILQGQAPQPVNALAQGAMVGQQVNDINRTNEMRAMMRQNGAGILAGDRNALNALAAFDPAAAQGIETGRLNQDATRLNMDATRQSMSAQQQQMRLQLEQHFAGKTAAEAQAEAAAEEQQFRILLGAQTPEQWDALAIQQDAPELVGQFGNREALANQYREIGDIVSDMFGGGRDLSVGAQQILEDGTIIQSTNQGPRVYSPTGEVVTGQAAADAIAAANAARVANETAVYQGRREGTLNADIDLAGEAAGVEKLATLSMEAGVQAFTDIAKVNSSLSNINEAIAAIDDGAASGLVYNMLPNVTEASASLNNAMNRMGLDVISAVTFGALSEAEMNLAMETAVPRNLSPADLRSWLVKKQAAQEKARDALTAAAQYLTTPGNTINSWLAEQNGGQGGQPQRFRFNPETGAFE